MTKETIIAQVDHYLKLAEQTYAGRGRDYPSYVDNEKFSQLKAGGLSFIKNVFGTEHPYYTDFKERVTRSHGHETLSAIGILKSIKIEFENNWFLSLKGLVAEEIFSDLLDMSKYFQDEGYKDPAAIMTGCVLEEHLRQLCLKHGIELTFQKGNDIIHKKADLLNADLAKVGVYGKLDSKNIVAWLDLRNKAAHGKFHEYNKEQVQTMIQGVSEFISRLRV